MSITFNLFNNKPNTVAVADSHSRIEGFLNGYHPHSRGNGGTMFLNDIRGEENKLHVAAVTVWGEDAEYAKAAAAHRTSEREAGRNLSIFISVAAQWQGEEVGTGVVENGYEKKISRMSFMGKNIIQVNPFKSGDKARGILGWAGTLDNNLPMFENQPHTLAPAEYFHRVEGFLSGYVDHESGTGGTLFLNDVRTVGTKKTKHVAAINVWDADAQMAKAAMTHLKATKDTPEYKGIFLSINVRWQAAEMGTGEMVGEFEKKTSRMSFVGKEIIDLNPKRSGEYARGVNSTSDAFITNEDKTAA